MIVRFFRFTRLLQVLVSIFFSFLIIILKLDELNLDALIGLILLISIFLISIFLISKNSLLKNNQFLTFSFIIFCCFISHFKLDYTLFLSYLFLLISLRKTYSLNSDKRINKKLFDIGVWFCLSFLLFPQSIIFLPTLIIGISIFYKSNFSTYFKMFFGIISIYIFSWAINFMLYENISFGNFLDGTYNTLKVESSQCTICKNNNITQLTFVGFYCLIFLVFLIKFFGANLVERTKSVFLLIFFINTLFAIYIIENFAIFLFFPFLITLTKLISKTKKHLITDIIFLAFILFNIISF